MTGCRGEGEMGGGEGMLGRRSESRTVRCGSFGKVGRVKE